MKKLLLLTVLPFLSTISLAQCLVVATTNNAPCCNAIGVASANGTPPFTYVWTPSNFTGQTITGLCAGTYTVTMTDGAGCTATATITVSPSGNPPTVSVTATNNTSCTSCNGTVTGTATGGTPPYSYQWMPSGGNSATATGLCPGTYTVIVTDGNGCSGTGVGTVGGFTPMNAFVTCSPMTCNQPGSACVQPGGGNGPYSYLWTPGGATTACISNVNPGCYTVTVTDANACTATGSCCIQQSSPMTATANSQGTTCGLCNGTANALVTGGQPPYTFFWSTNPPQTGATATGLCAGVYTVTAVDANGCTATYAVTVASSTGATVSVTATNASCQTCCDGTATGTPTGTGPFTYIWSPGGQTTQTATGLCTGVYSVCVTDAMGCTSCALATVSYSSGMDDDPVFENLSLFPNPAKNIFTVQFSNISLLHNEKIMINIMDMTGRKVMEQKIITNPGGTSFDISSLSEGVYMIRISVGDKWITRLLQHN
jgi:hypothetical protein